MVHLFPQTLSQEPEWKLILHFSVCSQVLQGSDSRPAEEAVVACGGTVHNVKSHVLTAMAVNCQLLFSDFANLAL